MREKIMKSNRIESKHIVCWLAALVFVSATNWLKITTAEAQTTTDQMTCNQVIASYEQYGRVYVRQRSGKVLPVYNGVPRSHKGRLNCERSRFVTGYGVKSSDKKRCVAMYLCR